MVALAPIFKKAYWSLVISAALYTLLILCLTIPFIQRHAVYVHKIHTAWYHDVNKPESFGFAKNQVRPFNLTTPDGESLYAWHILPLGLYAKHEEMLLQQPSGPVEDITKTLGFKLLAEAPEARLVINFHGNAGHVGEGHRPLTYRSLTSASPLIHVLSIDYRGFGHSTGTPSEPSLITDGVTAVHWALNVAKLESERVLLLGQSLGTAVATAVAESLPSVEFAGLILVAPFTSLPDLLQTYRILGVIPVLSPLHIYPRLQEALQAYVVDTWDTQARLRRWISGHVTGYRIFRLHLIHAVNDFEISWQYSEKLWRSAVDAVTLPDPDIDEPGLQQVWQERYMTTIDRGEGGEAQVWDNGSGRVVRKDILRYGGHNAIVGHSTVALAVLEAFDLC